MALTPVQDLRRIAEAVGGLNGHMVQHVEVRSDCRQLKVTLDDGQLLLVSVLLDEDGKPRYGDIEKCIECGLCHAICPEIDELEEESLCAGCRARALFESNPEMIGFAVDMWARLDSWPQSSTWMEAIPASGISVLCAEYHARDWGYPRRPAALSWTRG